MAVNTPAPLPLSPAQPGLAWLTLVHNCNTECCFGRWAIAGLHPHLLDFDQMLEKRSKVANVHI